LSPSISTIYMTEPTTLTTTDQDNLSKSTLNWLRAAVLGANDGIVSVSSIILGVAGATANHTAIFTAGIAGLSAGALSMAVGEYVSVSSQTDTEKAYIAQERWHLAHQPKEEFEELAAIYESKGLSVKTAHAVAKELTELDALKAHLDAEFDLDQEDLTSPLHAAIASLLSFAVGGVIPLLTIMIVSNQWHLVATVIAVLLALIVTGYLSARVGRAPRLRAIVRVVLGGAIAMLVTYGIGHLVGGVVG